MSSAAPIPPPASTAPAWCSWSSASWASRCRAPRSCSTTPRPRVTQDQLQPGDLVFFARTYADPHDWVTHVGIYIGDGLQINAPTEGQVVSIQPVFSGFWGAHYAGGGRVAPA